MSEQPKENQASQLGCGCLGLIIISVVITMLLPKVDTEPKTTPSRSVSPGEIISPNESYVPAICMETEKGFSEAMKWIARKDMEEAARAILRYGGQLVQSTDRLKILDVGILKTRVRVQASQRECYVESEVTH